VFWKNTTRYRCNECEVAPFKNGEHNSKSASTLDRDIIERTETLRSKMKFYLRGKIFWKAWDWMTRVSDAKASSLA